MKRLLFFVTAVILISASSCTKSDQLSENNDLIIHDAFLEQISAESDGILGEIMQLTSFSPVTKAFWGEQFLTGTVTISMRDSSSIRIVTVDFGTGNKGIDGKTRSGVLVAYIYANTKLNTDQKLKYQNFKVDGYLYNGQMTKNITRQVDSNSQQAVITEDFKVTFPDGIKFNQRVASMTRLYKFGDPKTLDDNTIQTFGTITLTNEKSATQTKKIAEATPLLFKAVPGEIVKGIATTTFGDGKVITIDYGDGTADNKATVSNGTKTWTITLKK